MNMDEAIKEATRKYGKDLLCVSEEHVFWPNRGIEVEFHVHAYGVAVVGRTWEQAFADMEEK